MTRKKKYSDLTPEDKESFLNLAHGEMGQMAEMRIGGIQKASAKIKRQRYEIYQEFQSADRINGNACM